MTENIITVNKRSRQNRGSQPDLSVHPEIQDTRESVRNYRAHAWKTYQSSDIPDSTQEDWRRTSLSGVNFSAFRLIDPNEYSYEGFPEYFETPVVGNQNGGTIMLSPVDSTIKIEDSLVAQGVVFDTLNNVAQNNPDLLDKVLARVETDKMNKFSALAGAVDFKGILLYVPRSVTIEFPLQSLFWAPGEGYLHSLHIFIFLEEGASVTYVHESSSPNNETAETLHAGLFDVYVGPGAHLNFVELQSWGENVVNFTSENVQVDRDGSVDWIFGALGSKLTKNYSNLSMIGKGATGKMSGFYFTDNKQHLDHDTQQNHLAPNTTSDLLFKGALLEQSRSVWQGMIYVAPEASKTDGYQANRNLVLSKQARADSIPGLEILTDDVRCTHGATVGKIDEEQVFYLLSRGLKREDAERLIVEGFFDPIMQRIPFEGVRNRFQNAIKEKMEHIR